MAETRSRKIPRRGTRAVVNDLSINSDGTFQNRTVQHYSNLSSLPGSGNEGDLAYVSAGETKYLYIYIVHDGDPYTASGWYSVPLGDAYA